ncbi:MAG: hypothetical protein ACRBCS_10095 [Cellvibrionaceae bacterium]
MKISVVLKFVIVLAVISFFVMRIVTFDSSFLAKVIGFLIAFSLCGLVVYEAKFGAGEFMKLKSSAESKMPKVVTIVFGILIIPFYIFSVYGLLFPLHLALSEKKVKVFDATYVGKSLGYRYLCKNEIYLPDLDLSYCVRDKNYLSVSKKIKYYRFKILLETKRSAVGFSLHLPDKKFKGL